MEYVAETWDRMAEDLERRLDREPAYPTVSDAGRAVAEMRRVVRPGGTVTAAVWDGYGGLQHVRMIWNVAAVLDPSIERHLFRPPKRPKETSISTTGLAMDGRSCSPIRRISRRSAQPSSAIWRG